MNKEHPQSHQAPAVGGGMETVTTHPAFGTLRFGRVSGSANLFGSEVDPMGFIQMEIYRAEERWHLHEKRVFSTREPLIRIALSHAQFAQAITSINMGEGTPCTLLQIGPQTVPSIASKTSSTKELLLRDIKQATSGVSEQVSQLLESIAALPISKKAKEELQSKVGRIQTELHSNLPFIVDQMEEAVETLSSQATTEVAAYISRNLEQLGLTHLQSQFPQLQNEAPAPVASQQTT